MNYKKESKKKKKVALKFFEKEKRKDHYILRIDPFNSTIRPIYSFIINLFYFNVKKGPQ